LTEGKHFFICGNCYEEFEGYVKKALETGSSLHGGPVGEYGGVRLLGLLREKENSYLGSFSWTQRTLKV
jgi:hypothetical protein